MANAVLPHSPPTASVSSITDRLHRLRSRVVAWFLVDGFSRFFAAAVLLIGIDLLVDWLFEMDRPQRIVMLAIVAAALAFVAWKRIVRPFRGRQLHDDALCLQVEARNASLGERLISAMQFSRQSDFERRGVSAAMVAATIHSGVRAADDVSFDDVLRRDRFLWNAVLLAASLVVLAGVAVGARSWGPLQIWFDRNILLRDDVHWPQDTVFHVDGVADGELAIPRGDDWLFVARVDPASKVFPEAAEIEIRKGGRRRAEQMKRITDGAAATSKSPDKPASPRFRFEYSMANVREPFEFRIRSSSGHTEWIPVRLVDRPEMQSLQLSAVEPKYAGGKTAPLAADSSSMYVLRGTRLIIAGTATKPLAAAEVLVDKHAIRLSVDGSSFSGSVEPKWVDGKTYQLRLVGTETLQFPNEPRPRQLESNPHPRFRLRIRPDRVPELTLKLRGIGGMVVPDATIPCEVQATDDFAITAARLKYDWRHRDDTEPRRGGDPLLLVNDALKDTSKQPWKSLPFRHTLRLKPLNILPGSAFNFQFEADDNDDVSGPKTGKTQLLTIRVVSEAELRDDLLRREKEQQQEFERLVNEQGKLNTEAAALRAAIGRRTDAPEKLRELMRQQTTLGKNLAGIAERLASIVEEFRNNHLIDDEKAIAAREEKIIKPMRVLAKTLVPQAAAFMENGRRAAQTLRSLGRTGKPEAVRAATSSRDAALAEAAKTHKAILESMDAILSAMKRTASYQEIVNLTYRVLKAQQQVLGLTDQEIKALLKKSLKSVPDKKRP
jgi:hypothetical protein